MSSEGDQRLAAPDPSDPGYAEEIRRQCPLVRDDPQERKSSTGSRPIWTSKAGGGTASYKPSSNGKAAAIDIAPMIPFVIAGRPRAATVAGSRRRFAPACPG
jgi:hypothetical protein